MGAGTRAASTLRLRTGIVVALTAMALAHAAESAPAATVKVKSVTRKHVTVNVKGLTGELCTVQARRGKRRKSVETDLGVSGRSKVRVRIRGRRRPTVRAQCARPTIAVSPGETVQVTLGKGSVPRYVLLERGGPFSDPFSPILYRETARAFAGWDYVDVALYSRASFSGDFGVMLFTGTPAGEDTHHIGALDLRTMQTVDLTAQRQGTSFSSPTLCEQGAAFLPQLSPTLRWSSDAIVFEAGTGQRVGQLCPEELGSASTSLSAPGAATPLPPDGYYISGLGEATPSPDGMFFPAIGDRGVRRVSDGAVIEATCDVSMSEMHAIGWLDSRRLVVRDDPLFETEDFRVIRISDDGTSARCEGGIPATGRSIDGVTLAPDRSAIGFYADTPSGEQFYELPFGQAEPVASSVRPPEKVDNSYQVSELYEVGPH